MFGAQALPPEAVAQRMRAAGVPLHVVAGGCDLTIPYTFAVFPPQGNVERVLVHHATHTDICTHGATLEHIERWLRATAGAAPR